MAALGPPLERKQRLRDVQPWIAFHLYHPAGEREAFASEAAKQRTGLSSEMIRRHGENTSVFDSQLPDAFSACRRCGEFVGIKEVSRITASSKHPGKQMFQLAVVFPYAAGRFFGEGEAHACLGLS
ncbi:MAG: hypothetical protein ACOZEN_06215 [Thermodesulfobacteriota bacterium]